ncbi:hypothetical protein BJ944DRAFT_241777 [Cunninghamella echinulata]|nr:hypothetical protein BJ944DRAFT_241777 [Cunninghamella echinulata]
MTTTTTQFAILNQELNNINKKYNYGLMPDSITIFVRDSINKICKMELILLEGILVIIEASLEGYMVLSCTPLYKNSQGEVNNALILVNSHIDEKFDTLDKLLITISPLFADRFIQHLQSSFISPPIPISSSPPPSSSATTNSNSNDIDINSCNNTDIKSTPQNLNLDFLQLELNHLDFDWSH